MYLSDLHVHSIASGHGTTCTISDLARTASIRGLRLLGITDHGPATMAAGTPSYFRSLAFSPRRRYGLELRYGVELNLLDADGRVDLEDEVLEKLDYAIVSMHLQNYRPGSREENTQALISAMKRYPKIKILGHCDQPCYELCYDALARAACACGVVFEMNEASLAPWGYRGDTRENAAEILRCCLRCRLPILLSSDSHGPGHLGDFSSAAAFVHQAAFPETLILNNQLSVLKKFLQESSFSWQGA